MIIETIPQLAQLSCEEKLKLAEELRDDALANAGPDDFPLTPEQAQELERRLREEDKNLGMGTPYEEVVARVLADLDTMRSGKKVHV